MAFELDDLSLAGRGARKAERGLIDLRARAAEAHALGAGNQLADERAASASIAVWPANRMPFSTCATTASHKACGLWPRIIGPMPR